MRRIKRFLRDNIWVFVALVDIAMLLMLFYMIFGWMLDIAEFYAFMKIYAG